MNPANESLSDFHVRHALRGCEAATDANEKLRMFAAYFRGVTDSITSAQKLAEIISESLHFPGSHEPTPSLGHNHRGETRIYAESFRRCPEMLEIRRELMELAKSK